MEYLNLTISLGAIILSVIAIAFGWHQHSTQVARRKREIIADLIGTLKKFSHVYEIMLYEREKTGSEICDYEEKFFSNLSWLSEIKDHLNEDMEGFLKKKKIKLNDQEISQALMIKASAESLTTWIEYRHDRFKRFNDNRISELKEPFEKLAAIFANKT